MKNRLWTDPGKFPYEPIGFGAIIVSFPYENIGFEATFTVLIPQVLDPNLGKRTNGKVPYVSDNY